MAPLSSFTVVAVLALAASCAACNPIETYRDVRGINKNDPDPATAPFSGNIAAADAAPYPNLASVPPPPVRATSTTDRQKLTESLIAERTATAAAATTPAPPAAAPPAVAPPAVAPPKTAVAAAPVSAAPPPAAPPPAAPPPPVAVAAPAPPPPAPPAPAPPAPVAAAAPASEPPKAPVAAEATPAATAAPGKQATNKAPPPRSFKGQPAEAPPMDSSLEMPQVRSRPEPEAVRPPLPPASLARVAAPAPAAATPPDALASVAPAPAPPPPAPALLPAAPALAAVQPPPRRAPATTTVATLRLAEAAAAPDRAEIDRVAALYREQPGSVRVLAFAAAPTGGGDPLASYHAALGRAQQIAKALADAGIPANKIQTEASPSPLAAGRIDIQFAP